MEMLHLFILVLTAACVIDSIFYANAKYSEFKSWHLLLGAGTYLYFTRGGK